jgi:hypothetical protein
VELGVSYLKEDGYFFPFGVVLKCDGVVDVVEGYVGDDFPDPGVLLSGVLEDCGRLVAGGGILVEERKGDIAFAIFGKDGCCGRSDGKCTL